METYINRLKASLFFQIAVGIIGAIVLAYLTVSAGMDAQSSSAFGIAQGAVLAATMALIPLVLVPVMSLRELAQYREQHTLFINHAHSFIVIAFLFFPLAFWQIYLLKKIKTSPDAPVQ